MNKKQYDRIQIKWKEVLEDDKKLHANKYDKAQIKQRCRKNKWKTTIQDST